MSEQEPVSPEFETLDETEPSPVPDARLAHLPETPAEETTTMLDVHPAHHAAHSWKEFFIHIATIVLGLIIAVGLENTVEYLHHRSQAKEAREALQRELTRGREVLRINVFELKLNEKNLRANLAVLHRLRRHSPEPDDRLLVGSGWRIFSDVAWKNAVETGAVAYLSPEERTTYSFQYLQQNLFNTEVSENIKAFGEATAVLIDENPPAPHAAMPGKLLFEDRFTRSEEATEKAIVASSPLRDLSHLTPAQIDRLELGTQVAIAGDSHLLGIASIIKERQDDAGHELGGTPR
jgi:hypothetical protein